MGRGRDRGCPSHRVRPGLAGAEGTVIKMKWLIYIPIWIIGIPLVIIMGCMEMIVALFKMALNLLDELYHRADEW